MPPRLCGGGGFFVFFPFSLPSFFFFFSPFLLFPRDLPSRQPGEETCHVSPLCAAYPPARRRERRTPAPASPPARPRGGAAAGRPLGAPRAALPRGAPAGVGGEAQGRRGARGVAVPPALFGLRRKRGRPLAQDKIAATQQLINNGVGAAGFRRRPPCLVRGGLPLKLALKLRRASGLGKFGKRARF